VFDIDASVAVGLPDFDRGKDRAALRGLAPSPINWCICSTTTMSFSV
jgi:hypothetical protein